MPNSMGISDEGRVSSQAKGEYLIAWHDRQGGVSQIYARGYDKEGNPLGREVRISGSSEKSSVSPDIVAIKDGACFVTWSKIIERGEHAEILYETVEGRLVAADGAPLSPVIEITDKMIYGDPYDLVVQSNPSVAAAGQNIMVTWYSANMLPGDTTKRNIRYRIYNYRGETCDR